MIFSEEQRKAVSDRRKLFVSEVLYCSDASEKTMRDSGWKEKTEWLADIVSRYRKDLARILKD